MCLLHVSTFALRRHAVNSVPAAGNQPALYFYAHFLRKISRFFVDAWQSQSFIASRHRLFSVKLFGIVGLVATVGQGGTVAVFKFNGFQQFEVARSTARYSVLFALDRDYPQIK